MKKYRIILLVVFLTPATLFAQDIQGNQKLTKEQRKELRKQKTLENRQKIVDLLKSKQWILEANTVYDRYNQSYILDPTINFVGVNGKEAALQLGFNGVVGWNGVGGVTVEGTVTSYKVKEGKSGPGVDMRFSGRGAGSANIHVTVNSTGNATARVNGDFGSRITFQGQLVPTSESRVYQGQSLF